ncbi:sugar transferase [Candidatus Thioglobus sp.]|nr:sugar transferase [Candidatus Thioglobus sp.]
MKRLFDLLFSFFGLVLLTPFYVYIALWIKLDSKGSIFFRQERVGLKGVIFKIHKFRTMKLSSEDQGRLTIGNDSRITKSGEFLRKYKIDELPQLIDVFIGKMSLVGPRPEVREFIEEYPLKIKDKILSIRPGITDMASIRMVNENDILGKYKDPRQAYIDIVLPIKQKYYLDYVNNHNIWLDLKIIFLTLKKIIDR